MYDKKLKIFERRSVGAISGLQKAEKVVTIRLTEQAIIQKLNRQDTMRYDEAQIL